MEHSSYFGLFLSCYIMEIMQVPAVAESLAPLTMWPIVTQLVGRGVVLNHHIFGYGHL